MKPDTSIFFCTTINKNKNNINVSATSISYVFIMVTNGSAKKKRFFTSTAFHRAIGGYGPRWWLWWTHVLYSEV
jgi:hypothetical protein